MAIKFTKLIRAAIKNLEPGKSISEHGITAKASRNGDVTYSVNVMVDNQRIHRVIGRASEGVTREQAERAIEAFRTKAREERLDLPTGRKHHPTFAELATRYIRRATATNGRNLNSKRRHIETLLVPHFGEARADRISTALIEDYVSSRHAIGRKQATINRELATLSHALRESARWGWIKGHDVPLIRKGTEAGKKITVLSDEDACKLMDAAIADIDDRVWLFVAFGLNTGMRHSEILQVKYEQVNFDLRRLHIPEAKSGEREQPITATLAGMLMRQRLADGEDATWIFPRRTLTARKPHRVSMAKPFLRSVERAGLSPSKVTPHVMRHTAITRLVRAGVDLPTIQRISGHKTLAMVMRYAHIHGQHIDKAIAAIDGAFGADATPNLHQHTAA